MELKKLLFIFLVGILMGGCAASGTRIDNVPMYGQPEIERPATLKKADEEFIEKVTAGLGSREKASQAWWAEGEKYMNAGNLDYAMRRYNQSWLLNPKNYQPHWGFARVMLEQGKIDDALKYLANAEQLIDDPYQKVALLADIGSAYTMKGAANPAYFEKANKKFAESIDLDAKYWGSWRRWAFSLYEQGDYQGAREKMKRAQELNARPFPPEFISGLAACRT